MKRLLLSAALSCLVAVPLAGQSTGTVTGIVFDSTTMEPLVDARVAILGTSVLSRSGDDGRFTLEEVPVGPHSVTFFHPRLQTLGISASAVSVDVAGSVAQDIRLSVPSEATLVQLWCLAEGGGPGTAALAGMVTDSLTGVPLPRAEVRVFIMDADGRTVRALSGRTQDSGYYRICNLPGGANMRAQTFFGRSESPPFTLDAPAGASVFKNVSMALSQIGEIQGTVTNYANGSPLVGARVTLVGGDQEILTNMKGEFVMEDVPPGLHLLETEFLGYATQIDSVTIFSDEAVLVDIPLATDAIEIRGMTVTARARVGEPLVAIGTRQDFLSRPEVDALLPRARNMGDLIQGAAFPGLSVRFVQIDNGAGIYPGVCVEHNRVRSGSGRSGGCNMISVFVDGIQLPDPSTFLLEMDPNRVETIQLIDPSDAQMVYGNRGINGVVDITTRRGTGR